MLILIIKIKYIILSLVLLISHLANFDQITENDYNLSVSTYVEAKDTREIIDIKKLNSEIERIVAHEEELRTEIAKIIAEIEL